MTKRVPMRTCVGCRQQEPKRDLLRIVRSPDGEVGIDPTGKAPGRGAYLCPRLECLELALQKNRLGRALRCEIDPETTEVLKARLGELQ